MSSQNRWQSHKIESWEFSAVSFPPDPQGGVKLYQYCSSVLPLGGRGGMKQRKTSKIQFYAIALIQNIRFLTTLFSLLCGVWLSAQTVIVGKILDNQDQGLSLSLIHI